MNDSNVYKKVSGIRLHLREIISVRQILVNDPTKAAVLVVQQYLRSWIGAVTYNTSMTEEISFLKDIR